MADKSIVKPPALRPGDTIAVIAPAGPIDRDRLACGRAYLRELGYEVRHRDDILDRELYFAGSLERRLSEFHDAFADPTVRAVLCARGGYGCNHLLPQLDFELIRRNPKLFIGLSDITTLLTAIHDTTGLVVLHGPMAAAQFAERAVGMKSWTAATRGEATFTLSAEPLLPGAVEGKLYGGCLSLLVASLGTPWEIQTEGTILFLEDVNEPAYRIDRMLMHLKLAGKLNKVLGVAFGKSLLKIGETIAAEAVIRNVIGNLDVPVAVGIQSGHIYPSATVPIGVRARLDCNSRPARLTVLEPATLADSFASSADAEPGPGEE